MSDDPRKFGGGLVGGSGDPHARDDHLIDARNAVLLDYAEVSTILIGRGGLFEDRPTLAMVMHGRVNKSSDRAEILYLFDEDGAAAIISQLFAMASRLGPEFADRLMLRVRDLIEQGAT